MSKKISVIMGVYNCEKTLEESINSIINQSYENWEFIICDDGSTDGSYKILKNFSDLDKRIKVIKNSTNRGLAFSLNKCIDIATGDYIARHDGDDISLKLRFEKQLKFLNENEYDLVGSAVEYFDENGIWGNHYIKEFPTKLDVFKQSMFSHPTIMVKKEVFMKVNKYTVSNITYRTEDYDLFAKIYKEGYLGANIQEVLFKVRRDKDAYSRRKFRFRIDESRCKYKAYKLLKMDFKNFYVVLLPIIKAFIPKQIFKKYHEKKFSS